MKNHTIYLDGKYVKANHNELVQLSPGHLGAIGAFETIRLYDRQIFGLDEHMSRLIRGLKKFHMRPRIRSKQLSQISSVLCKRNNIHHGRLRITQWKEGAKTRISMVAQPIVPISEQQMTKGYTACVSTYRRNRSGTSHIKSVNYRIFKDALQEACEKGCDEAFLFNNHKFLVEGSHTNVFIIKKNEVFTPAVSDGCLNGITRTFVINLLQEMGLKCYFGKITQRQLENADEIFLTNSIIELMPVTALRIQKHRKFKAGSVTFRIRSAYQQLVKQALLA